jgi:hypothetical protein
MDYENTIYFITSSQHFHPLSLFKYKHLEKLNFPHYFMANVDNFYKVFYINK